MFFTTYAPLYHILKKQNDEISLAALLNSTFAVNYFFKIDLPA